MSDNYAATASEVFKRPLDSLPILPTIASSHFCFIPTRPLKQTLTEKYYGNVMVSDDNTKNQFISIN